MKLGLTTLEDVRRHIIFARATWMLTTIHRRFQGNQTTIQTNQSYIEENDFVPSRSLKLRSLTQRITCTGGSVEGLNVGSSDEGGLVGAAVGMRVTDGVTDGFDVGPPVEVGWVEGANVGITLAVGVVDGSVVGLVEMLGYADGIDVGCPVEEGCVEGTKVGTRLSVEVADGLVVGLVDTLGYVDGIDVGWLDELGTSDGLAVGGLTMRERYEVKIRVMNTPACPEVHDTYW